MKRTLILALAALTVFAAVAVAAPPKKGSYKGKTEQNRSITFKVSGGKVKAFSGGVNMICGQSGLEINAVIPPKAMKLKGGRFSYKGRDKVDGNNIEISGRVNGGKASGKLRMTDSRYDAGSQSFDVCAGSAKWKTRRR